MTSSESIWLGTQRGSRDLKYWRSQKGNLAGMDAFDQGLGLLVESLSDLNCRVSGGSIRLNRAPLNN